MFNKRTPRPRFGLQVQGLADYARPDPEGQGLLFSFSVGNGPGNQIALYKREYNKEKSHSSPYSL